MKAAPKIKSSAGLNLLLALIVAIAAFAIRAPHADYKSPYPIYYDEPQTASTAQNIIKTRDFNPHFFNYGSLTIYIHALSDFAYLAWNTPIDDDLRESLQSIVTYHDGAHFWFTSHPELYVINRLVTAGFGAGIVFLTYWLCFLVTQHPMTAIFAAVLVAVNSFHISNTTVITVDGPTSFWSLLAILAALHYKRTGKVSAIAGALFLAGVTTASKYNSAVILFAPLAALLSRQPWAGKKWTNLPWKMIIGFSAAGFFITMPYALLDAKSFLSDLAAEFLHYSKKGHAGVETSRGIEQAILQIQYLVSYFGLPVCLLMIFGFPIDKKEGDLRFILIYPAALFVLMSLMKVGFHRNLIPIYPFIAILAANGAANIFRLIAILHIKHRAATASIAFMALTGLLGSAAFEQYQVSTRKNSDQSDSRTKALQFIQQQELSPLIIAEELQVHPTDITAHRLGSSKVLPLSEIHGRIAAHTPGTYMIPAELTTAFHSHGGRAEPGSPFYPYEEKINRHAAALAGVHTDAIVKIIGPKNNPMDFLAFTIDPEVLIIHYPQ